MCKKPPAIATPAPPSSMIGAATIPRRRRRSSRPTDLSGLTAARLRAALILSSVRRHQRWLLITRFSGRYELESDEGGNHPAGAAREKGHRKRPRVFTCRTGG